MCRMSWHFTASQRCCLANASADMIPVFASKIAFFFLIPYFEKYKPKPKLSVILSVAAGKEHACMKYSLILQ